MSHDTLIVRLAAVDPLPADASLDDASRERLLRRVLETQPARPRPARRLLVAAAAAAAIAVPAAAFAGDVGQLLGISNPGTPVATTALVGRDSALTEALAQLRFPAQVADLGARDGFHFYVTRNDGGDFCFAISAAGAADPQHPKVVGCTPADVFPGRVPLLDFSTGLPNGGIGHAGGGQVNGSPNWDRIRRLWGFAADGVASVALLDANGATMASTPVEGNVYLDTDVPQVPAAALVARDASGAVLYRIG